jgi:hypothetical protein
MREKGHTYDIIEQGPAKHPNQITRQDYIAKVKLLLKRSRGRELPGTFDPLVIGHLFLEQRKSWAALVNNVVAEVVSAVNHVVCAALSHVSDRSTLEGLLRNLIYPRFECLKKDLQNKITELLKPHDTGHPITYNHYLTENVQKAQGRRRTCEIKKTLRGFLGEDYTTLGVVKLNVDVDSLTRLLINKTEADMNNYASSTAIDFMEAYYKVRVKTSPPYFRFLNL